MRKAYKLLSSFFFETISYNFSPPLPNYLYATLHLSSIINHTRPIVGTSNVKIALSNYRDAIAHVFNTTIEGMNKGLTPDELVNM